MIWLSFSLGVFVGVCLVIVADWINDRITFFARAHFGLTEEK